MYKGFFALIVAFGVCCSVVFAQEQKGSALLEWLKGIQKKIDQIVPKKAVPLHSTVAGVRRAKEDASLRLYWKGKKGEEPVTEEEMAQFKEAIGFAAKGDKPGAVKELEEFLKQYPDSALVPDAKKTIDLIRAEERQSSDKKDKFHNPDKPEPKL